MICYRKKLFRSKILLEIDDERARNVWYESNKAFSRILESHFIVVIGMSFKCVVDRYTLAALGCHGRNFPIAKSFWLLLNLKSKDNEKAKGEIARYLPEARFKLVDKGFDAWIADGVQDLIEIGVLNA